MSDVILRSGLRSPFIRHPDDRVIMRVLYASSEWSSDIAIAMSEPHVEDVNTHCPSSAGSERPWYRLLCSQ